MTETNTMGWSIAAAMGMALGFLAALSPAILQEARTGIAPVPGASLEDILTTVLGWLAMGAIFGVAQSVVLRGVGVPVVKWILASVVGFGIGAVVFDLPLQALGLLGNIPGPVEPIILTHGGGILAATLQYVVLRREGIFAAKWLAYWVVGLVISLIPTAVFFYLVEGLLGLPLNWAAQVFANGFIVGGVAAFVSATRLFSAIEARK